MMTSETVKSELRIQLANEITVGEEACSDFTKAQPSGWGGYYVAWTNTAASRKGEGGNASWVSEYDLASGKVFMI